MKILKKLSKKHRFKYTKVEKGKITPSTLLSAMGKKSIG
jgi:hypothetical protein